ncbi:hypothetical protein CW304_29945 [Bacillus sp. UFRGS-B20]|nr:hypothetical protein CW304_29945 [Bacillus sp. UFRGS-B20]
MPTSLPSHISFKYLLIQPLNTHNFFVCTHIINLCAIIFNCSYTVFLPSHFDPTVKRVLKFTTEPAFYSACFV